MQEENFSLKEIMQMSFKEIKEHLMNQDKDLKDIKVQTTATNGRVNKLEWWQRTVVWALGVLWVFLIVIIPVLYKVAQHEQERVINKVIDAKWMSLMNEYDSVIINNNNTR